MAALDNHSIHVHCTMHPIPAQKAMMEWCTLTHIKVHVHVRAGPEVTDPTTLRQYDIGD